MHYTEARAVLGETRDLAERVSKYLDGTFNEGVPLTVWDADVIAIIEKINWPKLAEALSIK